MIRNEPVINLLRELNEVDESESLEAKDNSGPDVGKSTYETICALSNEPGLGGGTILLGVSKEAALFPVYKATGVSDADKLTSDLSTGCASMFNIPIRVDIQPTSIDSKIVLKIDVNELQTSQKPLYFRATGLPKGAYRRVGATDVKCTDEDLFAFFQGKANDPPDSRVVASATMDDVDPAAISAYRKARASAHPLAAELAWSDEDMLHSLCAITRLGGTPKLTTTGIIAFGKDASIRRLFPTHRVDYIRVPGKVWVEDPDTRFESIDMRGSIMGLVSRIIAAISDDLPKSFSAVDRSGQRTERPVIPIRVLREAVVNALMHRNYQVYQPVQVIRYANRIVIKNPGYSLNHRIVSMIPVPITATQT